MLLAQCMLDLWPGAGLFAEPDAANRLETREARKPAHHLAYHPVRPAHCDDHWHPEWWDVGLIACLFASLSARLSVLLPDCLPTCTCRCLSAWLTVFVSSLSCIFSLFKRKVCVDFIFPPCLQRLQRCVRHVSPHISGVWTAGVLPNCCRMVNQDQVSPDNRVRWLWKRCRHSFLQRPRLACVIVLFLKYYFLYIDTV